MKIRDRSKRSRVLHGLYDSLGESRDLLRLYKMTIISDGEPETTAIQARSTRNYARTNKVGESQKWFKGMYCISREDILQRSIVRYSKRIEPNHVVTRFERTYRPAKSHLSFSPASVKLDAERRPCRRIPFMFLLIVCYRFFHRYELNLSLPRTTLAIGYTAQGAIITNDIVVPTIGEK